MSLFIGGTNVSADLNYPPHKEPEYNYLDERECDFRCSLWKLFDEEREQHVALWRAAYEQGREDGV